MDNVTHSLAGLLLAEGAIQLRARFTSAKPSSRFRAVAMVSSLIAANLPDADLFYTGIGGNRLRYMLHHRGYTHTVVGAVLGAVLVWGVATVVLRAREKERAATGEGVWLFALVLVSTLSHLVLDWTNSYGVHPFWPVDDRWRYGDAVFIVEPWLWVVSVPALFAASRSRIARALLALVLIAVLVLAWRVDLVSAGAAALLTAGAAIVCLLSYALPAGRRLGLAVGGWIVVTLVMAAGTRSARGATLRAVHRADPGVMLLDVIVSPMPANAVCTSVITVERSDSIYRVEKARVSAAPLITGASRCGGGGSASSFRPSLRPSTSAVHWDGEWTAPSEQIVRMARESCPALAALRFIRAPIWAAAGDSSVLLGDVRYGGGSGGFTDVRVPRHAVVCPEAVPPWTPPRADLLAW